MLKCFRTSFLLRNTYRKNGVIFSLKSLPLIRRILPYSLYESKGLNVLSNIISTLLEISSIFVWKFLYVFLYFIIASEMQPDHIMTAVLKPFVLLTVVGGFFNTKIFDPSKDKYYAINLMRMDATKYALTDYFYFLLKHLIGMTTASFLLFFTSGMSALSCILIPLYIVGMKLFMTAISLKKDEKKGTVTSENSLKPELLITGFSLLAVAYIPMCFDVLLVSEVVFWVIAGIVILLGAISLPYIIHYPHYTTYYKELLKPENYVRSSQKTAGVLANSYQKKMTADTSIQSNKSGYYYFNELFMKRHSKILTKSAKIIAWCMLFAVITAIALCFIFPNLKPGMNKLMVEFFPIFLFAMYSINRGQIITSAMFMNCDHSMLAFRFYRQPKAILTLFRLRMKYVIWVNLLPAAVLAVGLPILLYVSGGTDEPIQYAIIFVTVLSMSVFFSVHATVLYYLLQPYNIDLQNKNPAYSIISGITYGICYGLIRVRIPTLYFGIVVTAFCIIYALVALLLAYKLAPKTFKLRQ